MRLTDRAERRIGQNQIEAARLEPLVLVEQVLAVVPQRFAVRRLGPFKEIQRVVTDDVGVPIVVDDHVHLGDTGQLFVDFQTEKIFLGEVMPILPMGVRSRLLHPAGLTAHMVERVKQKATRTTGRVQYHVLAFRVQHFHGKGDQFARGEVLAEIALEKSAHELLESHALGVEFGAVERNSLQMLHALRENGRIDVDLVGEDIRLLYLLVSVKPVDADGQRLGALAVAALESVGLAIRAIQILFVAMLDEDDFAELPESRDRATPPAFPKGLVAFSDGGAQFLARNGGKVLAGFVFVKAPFGRFAIADRDVRRDISVTLARRKFVEAQQAASQAGNDARIGRAEAGAVAASLFDGLGKFGGAHVRTLALEHEPGRFQFAVLIRVNDEIGKIVGRAARHLDLEADTLGPVLILVDEFSPKLGAHLLLRVGPAFRVVRGEVVDTLRFALAAELGVAVCDSLFEIGLGRGRHLCPYPLVLVCPLVRAIPNTGNAVFAIWR